MRAFIGLGGNLGEPAVAFRTAVAELRGIGQVVKVSSLYDTAPRDSYDQPHFLNAALELLTEVGQFTSACAITPYTGGAFPDAGGGLLFVAEPVHNLVHREIVRPLGVTFTSTRPPSEQNSEFLASTDNWSRFVATRTGPDGALYIVDMYRLVIEHPSSSICRSFKPIPR